jgi:hypothetical protein
MKIISVELAPEPRMPMFDDRGQDYQVIYTTVGNTRWVKRMYAVDELQAYKKGRRVMIKQTRKMKIDHVRDLQTIMEKMPNPVTEAELKKYTKDLKKHLKQHKT